MDKGPWKATARHDGKLCVASEDFEHDVQLIVSGDFADEGQRADYCAWLAGVLNKATTNQPDAGRALYERQPWPSKIPWDNLHENARQIWRNKASTGEMFPATTDKSAASDKG